MGELLKDYDCTIKYHPGRANVLDDMLSRRAMTDLRVMFAQLSLFDDGSLLVELQKVKAEHQLPSGLLQSVKILLWKWKRVTMDFTSGLPLTPTKKDSVWVIKLAKLYIVEIIRLHEVSISIISDRDPRFTSQFWRKLHEALGSRLDFSTAFYPQTDGQSDMVLQILKDTLRSCVIDFRDDKVRVIRDLMKVVFDRQKSYVDLKRKDIEFYVGDFAFLKVSPWKTLKLPLELDRIHDEFHVSMLRRYRSDSTHIDQVEEIEVRPDLTFEEEPIQILNCDVKILRRKSIILVKVLRHNHRTEEATWEPEDSMRQ
ncbi:uncharacterized protein [Gossypium hirsutum]|uniref:Reverse transcriptase n=1 Tax=Gossypium hirsutum TaxID=3635 RepID=A0ABM2ZBT2_GOSHI|nr:uncharacterized protein LOC121211424 [Gossypium hirsutum]